MDRRAFTSERCTRAYLQRPDQKFPERITQRQMAALNSVCDLYLRDPAAASSGDDVIQKYPADQPAKCRYQDRRQHAAAFNRI